MKRRSLTDFKPSKDVELEFVRGSKPKQPKEKSVKKPSVRRESQPEEAEAETQKPKQEIILAEQPAQVPAAVQTPPAGRRLGRSPLTTRLRTDLFEALKQASLKRQLSGEQPNQVQEILEEALEPWLRKHGYLP
jgi:hypothetical protein